MKFKLTSEFKPTGDQPEAIRQLVDEAVMSDQVVDIFDAAGIKKPDISILSDEFMEEIKGMQHKNIALELLKKILNDEIRGRSRKNMIQSKALSEMLENAINRPLKISSAYRFRPSPE